MVSTKRTFSSDQSDAAKRNDRSRRARAHDRSKHVGARVALILSLLGRVRIASAGKGGFQVSMLATCKLRRAAGIPRNLKLLLTVYLLRVDQIAVPANNRSSKGTREQRRRTWNHHNLDHLAESRSSCSTSTRRSTRWRVCELGRTRGDGNLPPRQRIACQSSHSRRSRALATSSPY